MMLAYLRSALQSFVRDRRGAIGVMAAGAIPVLTVLVGAAVDYARVEDVRARLQRAADAAALAITQAQVLEEEITEERGDALIDANLGPIDGVEITKREFDEQDGGYALVTLAADVDLFFLPLVGYDVFNVTVISEAQFAHAPDTQVTVLFDNSASMLIGASPTDIAGFESLYGCAFVCHTDHSPHLPATYEDAKSSGYETRLDVARDAIIRSFDIADRSGSPGHPETYYDIYTFAYGLKHIQSATAADLNSSNGGVVASIGPAEYEGSADKYAATDYEAAFAAETDILAKLDAHPDREHFLLFVTDGVADYAKPNRVMEAFDSSLCANLKAKGVKIGVIYTTYFDIPNEPFWVYYIKPFSDQIAPALEACASPGWFFEAQYADDIDAALQELMKLVLPRPQLTR